MSKVESQVSCIHSRTDILVHTSSSVCCDVWYSEQNILKKVQVTK